MLFGHFVMTVKEMMDTKRGIKFITLPDMSIFTLAFEKYEILNYSDPHILFHRIQTSIIFDTVPEMIYILYQTLIYDEWDP
jgi:hypothetical protein